ncbi:hypothetical protein CHUAL_012531 [Chamberlinius hualienensis]
MDDSIYLTATCIIPSLFTASIVIIYISKWLRPRFSITVNCWFCQRDTTLSYNQRNSWVCPSCKQYNGFDKNGDYNCVISSQYNSPFDHSSQYCDLIPYKENKNGLCVTCNRNQVLKVKQLAHFEPLNEEYYNEEVEDYRQYLESIYRLCSTCEVVVKQKLSYLNREHRKNWLNWRLGKKSELLTLQRERSTNGMLRTILVHVFRFCSVLIGLFSLIPSVNEPFETDDRLSSLTKIWTTLIVLFINGNRLFLHIFGFFSVTVAIFTAGINSLQILDAVVCFAWLLMVFIYLPIFALILSSYDVYEEVRIVLTSLAVLTSVYAMLHDQCNLKSKFGKSRSMLNGSMVKNGNALTTNTQYDDKLSDDEDDNEDCKQLQDDQISTTFSSPRNRTQKDITINGDLSAMTISTPKKSGSLSNVFTKKTYGSLCVSPEFSPPIPVVRSSILSPPRFQLSKSNYYPWGSSGNLPLNRSFIYGKFSCGYYQPVGISSSCPASRAGSVSGDDRFSIFSEPVAIPAPWNSILKPSALSCHQKSASPSVSVSSSNSSSCLNVNPTEDLENFKRVPSVKHPTLHDSGPFLMTNRQLLTHLLLLTSLIGNAFLIFYISDWKLPKLSVF